MGWSARVWQEVYRREALPTHLRWTLAAAGVRDWIRGLSKALREDLGTEAKPTMQRMTAELFSRRFAALRERHPWLPDDPRGPAIAMHGLYLMELNANARWMLSDLGGPVRGRERLRSARWTLRLSPEARWVEVATHLGELLIVLTERLPAHLPKARARIAEICFAMGERYARHVRDAFQLTGDPVEQAIEVLRIGEYVFHVNPSHTHGSDGRQGFLEGDACLWHPRPGWQRGHCGIFGQFQAGVCSVFGLRYQLGTTIPKHGGDVCRVELTPIRRKGGLPLQS